MHREFLCFYFVSDFPFLAACRLLEGWGFALLILNGVHRGLGYGLLRQKYRKQIQDRDSPRFAKHFCTWIFRQMGAAYRSVDLRIHTRLGGGHVDCDFGFGSMELCNFHLCNKKTHSAESIHAYMEFLYVPAAVICIGREMNDHYIK